MSAVAQVFAPLDRVRRVAYALLVRVSRPVVVRREPRVAFFGVALVAIAFALTVLAPMTLLLIAPIVLGVPHVVADVRYLVTRPRLHARWPLWILVGVPLVWCCMGGGVRAGMIATIGALVGARGSRALRAAGVAACAAVFALAWWAGPIADVAFAHLHNFIAVALFLAWRRRARALHWLPIAAFAVGCAILLAGVAAPPLSTIPYAIGAPLVPYELLTLGGRLVMLFAFAQAVHYSVWLRLVPEEDRPRTTPRTFASSWYALAADIGPWLLGAAVVTTLAFCVYAFFDVMAARDRYLQFAIFHGHLELAAGALLLVERRLPLS